MHVYVLFAWLFEFPFKELEYILYKENINEQTFVRNNEYGR